MKPLLCSKCGQPISASSKSGLCSSCNYEKRAYKLNRKCSKCGERITDWNKSGICQKCKYNGWERKKPEKDKTKYVIKTCSICGCEFKKPAPYPWNYAVCKHCRYTQKYQELDFYYRESLKWSLK